MPFRILLATRGTGFTMISFKLNTNKFHSHGRRSGCEVWASVAKILIRRSDLFGSSFFLHPKWRCRGNRPDVHLSADFIYISFFKSSVLKKLVSLDSDRCSTGISVTHKITRTSATDANGWRELYSMRDTLLYSLRAYACFIFIRQSFESTVCVPLHHSLVCRAERIIFQ